mmetsp:Transcript_12614/g.30445  ORF Transcript_12614/g.30445 Transcript_12614/m.30445 type:complete len:239 (-) Transcript_12614:371-1087(-)
MNTAPHHRNGTSQPDIQSRKTRPKVATKRRTAMYSCASPRRLMVFRSSTLPPSRWRVLSTACVYNRSICAACDCTCVAKRELSADISTTLLSARRTCSTSPVSSSTSKSPSLSERRVCCCCCTCWCCTCCCNCWCCCCVCCSPEGGYEVDVEEEVAAFFAPEGAAGGGGGGARRRLCSASASTFLNRTSRHSSNEAATRCRYSVRMSTTPCRCATTCAPSRRPAAVSSTVDFSSPMCA